MQLLRLGLALGAALFVVVANGSEVSVSEEQEQDDEAFKSFRHKAYDAALALRFKHSPTVSEQQKAFEHLVTATGFTSKAHGRRFPYNGTSSDGVASMPLEGFDDISVSAEAPPEALRELAKVFQDGHGVKLDFRLALQLFRLAAELGDPEAQGQMGFRYALGIDDLSCWSSDSIVRFGEPKPQDAILHYYFAAMGGDAASRMALGHRHLHGLGVPKSCWSAATYYQPVAEQVAELSSREASLPQIERVRLHLQSSNHGGLRAGRHKEVVQYYQYSADRGNTDAQTAVGQVLNYGTHGVARNHEAAMSYFKLAATAGDIEAMAHLGSMYANGYGTKRSDEAALEWWGKAARRNNPAALFGLAYMHLTARGVSQDYDKAFQYFSKAAEQGHADAHFYMGIMHLRGYGVRRKSVQRAFSYFTLASHAGHTLAQYNAAMMHMAGKGTPRSCRPAAALLKLLSEKGPEAGAVQLGHEAFFRAQYGLSLLHYLRAAEMGLEVAQSNAAWMLDRGYVPGANASTLAFLLYRLSAGQGNVHSLLAMGDAYFYGKGVEQDWVRSSAIYYEAYQERCAEAMFNLGFMHEFGVGVPKDLALAKRFYNMAQHTQADAFAPVYIANAWLKVHAAWEWLRPHLPEQLGALWDQVFALRPPHTSLFGPWWEASQGWLALPSHAMMHAEVVAQQWADAVGIVSILDFGDSGESATLILLMAVLFIVVRVRRYRAQQRRQQQLQPQAGGVGAGAAHAAAGAAAAAGQPAAAAPAQEGGAGRGPFDRDPVHAGN